jgi:hypothetical protein
MTNHESLRKVALIEVKLFQTLSQVSKVSTSGVLLIDDVEILRQKFLGWLLQPYPKLLALYVDLI